MIKNQNIELECSNVPHNFKSKAYKQNSSNLKSSSDAPDKKPTDFEPGSPEQTEQINQTGAIITGHSKYTIYCLTIIGQIEGHYILSAQNKTTKYEHVIPQLVAIEEEPKIDGLLILLNTVGGDVEAGLAIAELVAGMKKPMNGLILGVPQTFEYFQRMQERITNFVTQNSNISKDRFYELSMNTRELVMDIGTVLDGTDAVREGLIDNLGNLSDALSCLYGIIDDNKKDHDKNKHEKSSKSKKKSVKNKEK